MLGILKKLFGTGSKVDYNMLLAQGAVIVDVRTPAEFTTGHIKGSLNIPLDQLKNKMADLKKKGKPVIACCRSGSRSSIARNILSAAGIESYNGGAWNSLHHKISNRR